LPCGQGQSSEAMATPIFNTSDNCLIPMPFPEIVFLSVPNRSLGGAEGYPLGDAIFLSRVHIPQKSAPRGGGDRPGDHLLESGQIETNVGYGTRFSEKIIVLATVGRERSRRPAYRKWVRDRSLVGYERRAGAALT
jgi:hypothetical protein